MLIAPLALEPMADSLLELADAGIGHLLPYAVQRISARPTMRMMALNM